jgi:membrane protein
MTLPRPLASAVSLLREAGSDWVDDEAPRLGAALAYYTAFSLAPLLVVVIGVFGLFLGQDAARGRLVDDVGGLVGPDAGKQIEEMIASARFTGRGLTGTLLGLATLLLGASGVFGELQAALNRVWDVKAPPSGGIMATIRKRFFSVTMVLGTAFLLLVSMVVSVALSRLGEVAGSVLPGQAVIAWVVDLVVSLGGVTLLFAMLFKYLPDVVIAWRDVWVGAAITAGLFVIGKFAIGLYLGHAGLESGFGAAGSLIVILVWVYYSAQIMLFGAEVTHVWAARRGAHRQPVQGATPVAASPQPATPAPSHHGARPIGG